jgi:hypothetical protein
MKTQPFENILNKIPEIAKAVNEFNDPELQKRAFDALMRAAGLMGETEPHQTPPAPDERETTKPGSAKQNKKEKKGRVAATAKRWSGDKYQIVDVDLHPKGKASLKDFYNEKAPRTDPERYITILYYLISHAGVADVEVNHIYTAFKQLGLKVPNIRKGLNNTRGRHAWVTFSAKGPVSLTRIGENVVEHDLPRQASGNNND